MSSIESVLTETRIFAPHETFRQAATVSGLPAYQALCDAAEQDYTGFWATLAQQEITWHTPFTETLDESNAPFFRWFADGKLNASYNCIDRHLEKRANKIALIFEADNGDAMKFLNKQKELISNRIKQLDQIVPDSLRADFDKIKKQSEDYIAAADETFALATQNKRDTKRDK